MNNPVKKKTKPTITYCLGVNTPHDDEFVNMHLEFVNSLGLEYTVELLYWDEYKENDSPKVSCRRMKNWGGPIGLLCQLIDEDPDSLGDYIFIFEADTIMKSPEKFLRVIEIINENPDFNYIGQLNAERHWWHPIESASKEQMYIKHASLSWCKCSDNCFWTDGGWRAFSKENLLKAKKVLGVLPGYIDHNSNDFPLDKNTDIDFRLQKPRIIYYEVGHPSRLKFHGFKFGGVDGFDDILRSPCKYDEIVRGTTESWFDGT